MDSLQRHIQSDVGRPPRRVGSLKSSVTEKPPIGRLTLTRTTSDSVNKGIEQRRFDKRSISYSEDYKKNLNMRPPLNVYENTKLNNCRLNSNNSLVQKDISSDLNPSRERSLSVDRKTEILTQENNEITKANVNTCSSGNSASDNEKCILRNVRNKSVERMSLEKQKSGNKISDCKSNIKSVKKEGNLTISSDNQQLVSKKLTKSKDGQSDIKFVRNVSNQEKNERCGSTSSSNTTITNGSAASPEKSRIVRKYSKPLEKLLSEKEKNVTDSLTKAHVSGEDTKNKIHSSEEEMKSLLESVNSDIKVIHTTGNDSVHKTNAYLLGSEKPVKTNKTAGKSDSKTAENSFLKIAGEHNGTSKIDYNKNNIGVSNLPRPTPKVCLSEKKPVKTDNLSRSKNSIVNNEICIESTENNSEAFSDETLGADSASVLINTHNDKFSNHKFDTLTGSAYTDRKFSLDSTCSLFNDIASKVKMGSDQSYIYGPPLGLYSQKNRDSIIKFDKTYGLVTDRLEKASSYNDYTLPRPRHLLGRTSSYSGPRLSHRYDNHRTYQMPASNRYGGLISREPYAAYVDHSKYVPRFAQPRSAYGNISSELNFKDTSDISGYCGGIKDDISPSVITTRIPHYPRSVSENQESTSGNIQRSLSVASEKSVLEKFLSKEKLESEMKGNLLTKEKKMGKCEDKSQTRVRKISRFLRPDFYDTPLEESVFSKNKDKKTDKMKQKDIDSNKEKYSGNDEKKTKPSLQCEKGSKQENKLSIIEKAIRSLRERSLGRGDSSCMSRESNLIKRAVSLDDCSIHHDTRLRRSSSVTPKSVSGKKQAKKVEKMLFKNKCDVQKAHEESQNGQKNVDESISDFKETFVTENAVGKDKLKLDSAVRRSSVSCGTVSTSFGENVNSSRGSDFSVSVGDDSGVYSVKKCHSLEVRNRAGRIAGLRPLDFSFPNKSLDSASNFEDDKSKTSFEIDDSTSFLSPTEDSDTWSASSDYADARDFSSPSGNTEDSVSERIRRKSFYLRFNQCKRRKPPSVPLGQYCSQSSKLPYTRSVSSDIAYLKNVPCNISDVNKKE